MRIVVRTETRGRPAQERRGALQGPRLQDDQSLLHRQIQQ